MKSTIIKACLLTFAGLFIGCAAKQAAAPPAAPAPEPAAAVPSVDVRLGRVIAINHNTFNLKNYADTERYENQVAKVINPIWQRHMPGIQWLVIKGDRGVNKGKYTNLGNIDTFERRNYYWPVPDADEYPVWAAALELLQAEIQSANPDTFELIEDTVRVYTDYVLVGSDQVAEMPLVGLLGIHEIKVIEGMGEAFETFITTKYYPATQGRIPGVDLFVYKGDRGADIGGYILVYAFDSVDRRDSYVPTPGTPSAALTEAIEAAPLPEGLEDEYNAFFESAEYTDWVIIK